MDKNKQNQSDIEKEENFDVTDLGGEKGGQSTSQEKTEAEESDLSE